MSNNQLSRITAIKAAFVSMTATQGWQYFIKVGQNLVDKSVQEALDEDDPIKGESKRIYAKAMRSALRDLLNAVEVTKAFDPESASGDSGLGELELEPSQEDLANA